MIKYNDQVITRLGDKGRVVAMTKSWVIVEFPNGDELPYLLPSVMVVKSGNETHAIIKYEEP